MNTDYQIVNCLEFTINNNIQVKINSLTTSENFIKQNSELKKLNDILEREINLLKSLILINNLNLNTSDSKTCNF